MKIVGYSERGALNALFYSMAFNKNERQGEIDMQSFLEMADVPDYNHYFDFEIYTESSLSQFGSPDLLFFAKTEKGEKKTVFFIEAKVSACKTFKMSSILNEYYKDIKKGEPEKPNTSNLFYQLEQKKTLFDKRCELSTKGNKIETNRGPKSIGKNPIVLKLVEKLKSCSNAEYIAIVPKEGEKKKETLINSIEDLNLKIVYWEDLHQKFGIELNYESFNETIRFNQGSVNQGKGPNPKKKSQILNNPISDENLSSLNP